MKLSLFYFKISTLLVVLYPKLVSASTYVNISYSCQGPTNDLRKYSSILVRWFPSERYDCLYDLRVSSSLALSVTYMSNLEPYKFTCPPIDIWRCPSGCYGLFYSLSEYGLPNSVYEMSELVNLRSIYLRLLYCSASNVYGRYFLISSSTRPIDEDTSDPIWRILGPVLATVAIMAAVFLVCVCYAQNFYQRDLNCCRNVCTRLRSVFRFNSTGNSDASSSREAEQTARAGGNTQGRPCQFVPPHIAAAEMLADEDRPPSYDDFHKYHRRDSFFPPPAYDTAVASLQNDMDLGSPRDEGGFDNIAFAPDVTGDMTVEVDLGDGSRRDSVPVNDEDTTDTHTDTHTDRHRDTQTHGQNNVDSLTIPSVNNCQNNDADSNC